MRHSTIALQGERCAHSQAPAWLADSLNADGESRRCWLPAGNQEVVVRRTRFVAC